MANDSFERSMTHVFAHEGGYADHPRDPGGATKYGITRATLTAWRGTPVSKTDVRRLTRDEAAAIYRARYWDAIRADDLAAGVDHCVFDAAVNSGPARAAKWLQAAVRVPQDGAVGPVTLKAAGAVDPRRLVNDICDVRLAFLRGLGTWAVFGRGWQRRIEEVRRAALEAVDEAPTQSAGPLRPPRQSRRTSLPPSPGEGRWAAFAAALRSILTGGLKGEKS